MPDLIITITIPDEENNAADNTSGNITFVARKGELGALDTLLRADFAELIEVAQTILADILTNPPNIPAPPQSMYAAPPKFNLNAEIEKLTPLIREAVTAWNFAATKITISNMIARLNQTPKPSEKGVEAILKKLVEERALTKLKYSQFGQPPSPPKPGLVDALDDEVSPDERQPNETEPLEVLEYELQHLEVSDEEAEVADEPIDKPTE